MALYSNPGTATGEGAFLDPRELLRQQLAAAGLDPNQQIISGPGGGGTIGGVGHPGPIPTIGGPPRTLPKITPFPGTKVITDTFNRGITAPGAGGGGGGGAGVAPAVTPPQPKPTVTFNTDPGVAAALAQEQLGLSQLDSALRAARERAVIAFGDPEIANLAGFGLDPQAGTFARQNYLSGNATLARLDKAAELARKAVINRLASKGILFSGDLGYLSGEAAAEHGRQVYDARQQLLDYLFGLASNDLEQRQAIRGNTLQAYQSAYDRYVANPDAYLGMFAPSPITGSGPGAPPKPKVASPKPSKKPQLPSPVFVPYE